MSLFNCIPNDCARVVWQKYEKGSGLRYRYSGEDWVYINGEDYSIDESKTLPHDFYRIYATATIQRKARAGYYADRQHEIYNIYQCGDQAELRATANVAGIILDYYFNPSVEEQSVILNVLRNFNGYQVTQEVYFDYIDSNGNKINNSPAYLSGCETIPETDNQTLNRIGISTPSSLRFVNSNNQEIEPTFQCIFTVFKNNEIIHAETREECPEVEILESGCKLSDKHEEIVIEKFSYLERVDVVDKYYQVYTGLINPGEYGLFVVAQDIPDNCLNIYNLSVSTIVPIGSIPFSLTNTPQKEFEYKLIAQICSDPDCPAPKFKVICDCDCQPCPDGTCAIICDDHVCCNDPTTGKNITSIPIDEYCEGS